ncbi:hypothetical protein GALL_537230 [mine drainage metagenome]|uniref:Uncharacterized protein n=1 Tax=mine drainage metagenome TaxID=410659 RepID=A0A1J5PB76_9ZZZZ
MAGLKFSVLIARCGGCLCLCQTVLRKSRFDGKPCEMPVTGKIKTSVANPSRKQLAAARGGVPITFRKRWRSRRAPMTKAANAGTH